jgi:CHRD domain
MRWTRHLATLAAAAAVGTLAGVAAPAFAQAQQVMLAGNSEVPPVSTSASGSGTVTINPDHTVSAKIVATGMTATMSHIHDGAAGANGPVIVPFVKTADNTFEAPPGAKLTDAQYADYMAGKLYVNVHSADHPAGEIRAQLAPK